MPSITLNFKDEKWEEVFNLFSVFSPVPEIWVETGQYGEDGLPLKAPQPEYTQEEWITKQIKDFVQRTCTEAKVSLGEFDSINMNLFTDEE